MHQNFAFERLVHIVNGFQGFVDYFQQGNGAFGGLFVIRGYRGDNIALVAGLSLGEHAFILHVETD